MEVLYYNSDFVIIVKPEGVDSEIATPSLIKEKLGGEAFTLHRLDKNVSGVMVYARNKKCAADLSRLIQNGEMIKEYLALVHGTPDNSGVFEDILFKDSRTNKVFVVDRERKGTKRAKLEYETLKRGECSLVKIRLHTGRSHQIRVQFASRKMSLVGDRKYGARDDEKNPRLFSYKITFPYKNEIMSFEKTPDWAK
jgi:23S rRNA pseudouridine1911/1915/1917 synthase